MKEAAGGLNDMHIIRTVTSYKNYVKTVFYFNKIIFD